MKIIAEIAPLYEAVITATNAVIDAEDNFMAAIGLHAPSLEETSKVCDWLAAQADERRDKVVDSWTAEDLRERVEVVVNRCRTPRYDRYLQEHQGKALAGPL